MKKIGLSFGDDEEDETEQGQSNEEARESSVKSKKATSTTTTTQEDEEDGGPTPSLIKKRLKPSSSVAVQAKAQTKSALAREASLKEAFRKQYLATNEAVRNTEFVLPFVFFEAKVLAGGKVRLKKGDFLWLFLERARKIGIELGERGEGPAGVGGRRREWARIGVDDLMVVVGEMMVPHVSNDLSFASKGGAVTLIIHSFDSFMQEMTDNLSLPAPRLSHAHPQQMRRLQRRSLPVLLRAHSSNTRTSDPRCRRHLTRTTTRTCRWPLNRRSTQKPTGIDPRLGAGRIRPRPESAQSRRSSLVREEQAHLPHERVGGLRPGKGLLRWRQERSRRERFLLFVQVTSDLKRK